MCVPSKHWVDIVEMWLLGVCKEELTAIGVWAFVGHGKNSPIIVLCGPHMDASFVLLIVRLLVEGRAVCTFKSG